MTEDGKIRMLVIPSDRFGCGKFRSVDPHVYIGEHYKDEFDVDVVYGMPSEDPEKFLRQYDIIHLHKQLDKECRLIDMMKFLGKKVIVDVDDNYDLGYDHPMSISAKKEKWAVPIKEHLKRADAVTTTTKIYASRLRKLNKNVMVFPNAINPDEPQFAVPKAKEIDRLRVGLICGSSHLKDIELMRGFGSQIDKSKVQIVLCGFDTNGTRTVYNESTGEVTRRPILPQESVWCEYEKIMTDDYRNVSDEHRAFLMQYAKGVDDPFVNEPYRRMWTRDISKYATHYANVDVLVAPLKENEFNICKSELKEIECGFTNTAFIGQDFGPYTINLVPMVEKGGKINQDGTALLVPSSKNHKLWAKYVNMLANDRDMVHRLQENLHNFVKDRYSIEAVCKKRVEFYKALVGK